MVSRHWRRRWRAQRSAGRFAYRSLVTDPEQGVESFRATVALELMRARVAAG